MPYERHYYTRPRLIPPAIPIFLLLASALYLGSHFVQLPLSARRQAGHQAVHTSYTTHK